MNSGTPIELSKLPIAPVNPDSPIPLYHQIEEDLRRLINNGDIPAEAGLPPEMALSEAYNVARHTMRMALSRLVADGLISRKAGKGTFVKPKPDRTKFFLDRSFSQQMADMGRTARTKVLAVIPGVIKESSPEFFVDRLGAKCLQLNRLRFGDEEPIGIQYSTILTDSFPDLQNHDFSQYGLYEIIAREYNIGINQICHTISAINADEFQAEALKISVGDPLLVVNTMTFLSNDQRFEYTTSYYRADRYEYSTMHAYVP